MNEDWIFLLRRRLSRTWRKALIFSDKMCASTPMGNCSLSIKPSKKNSKTFLDGTRGNIKDAWLGNNRYCARWNIPKENFPRSLKASSSSRRQCRVPVQETVNARIRPMPPACNATTNPSAHIRGIRPPAD